MVGAPNSVAAQRADIRFKIRLAKLAILICLVSVVPVVWLFVSAGDVALRVFAGAVAIILLLTIVMAIAGIKMQRQRADRLSAAR